MDTQISPFTIDVPDDAIADLQQRLAATRWPDAELVDDSSQGIRLERVMALANRWRHDYDWRAREAQLNRFDHFVSTFDIAAADDYRGDQIDLHFIHQRSPHQQATPLLITHGWPGSVVEFGNIIDALTNPTEHGASADDAFHVIAPSLPGYGFSSAPTVTGMGVERIGDLWAELMRRLGYSRYIAQGGDWGSAVTAHVGTNDSACSSFHVTLAMGARPTQEPTDPEEFRAIKRAQRYRNHDNGYASQQRTRPQTLGYGLADSPVGQLAWIAEKMQVWTDHAGQPGIDDDTLLDNVSLYWFNNTATSSARLYWESFGSIATPNSDKPVGVTVYPGEIVPPVRKWLEPHWPNIIYWNEAPVGGHFAALEVPDSFVAELRGWRRAVAGLTDQ